MRKTTLSILPIRHCVLIISLLETLLPRMFVWMNYPYFHHGPEDAIIWPNYLCKVTDKFIMKDLESGKTIYATSFSSLFQEWLETDEAKVVSKGFENTFLLPYPLRPVEIEITLLSPRKEVRTRLKHTVRPDDVLIHQKGTAHITPHKYLLKSGETDKCINVAILAEGYTPAEMEVFYQDAEIACKSLFSHEPFKSMKDRFNIVAVASPSDDSGVSVPRLGEWKHTAFNSHFSTFYSDRYLTTRRVKSIHDALAGIPYEHIIILANTEEYGGGGIYNAYTLTTAHHPMFRPVVVHEFGHSFGGLADEYFYDDDSYDRYLPIGYRTLGTKHKYPCRLCFKMGRYACQRYSCPYSCQRTGKVSGRSV